MKIKYYLLVILSLTGLYDSTYLAIEHFQSKIPPCTLSPILSDCGKVLNSRYSELFGIPLALIGAIYYFSLFVILFLIFKGKDQNRKLKLGALAISSVGLLSSIYFVYLQLIVLHAICIFCMGSAIITTAIFILLQMTFRSERKLLSVYIIKFLYKSILKRIFFLIDPEFVHNRMVRSGEVMGKISLLKWLIEFFFKESDKSLSQEVSGILFETPIGLAAGFDYEARLTQILPSLGFGFHTVGSITYGAYEGNPKPLLGRLPQSKSLMVNKGFKNLGAEKTIKKLKQFQFEIPLGISIGRTNTRKKITFTQSVVDIKKSFSLFEKSKVKHAYYELNISCPNLYGNISFYPPKNLEKLLKMVDTLKLSRPVFVKMPIDQSNKDTLQMLKVISKHKVVGVIFGNLQKDRKHPSLKKHEVEKFSVGNFSGKPTYDRSNELISLCYKNFKNRLIIIGCGGVFNASDAYEKIKRGATLVQLITGMIFEGPQLISQINLELPLLLKKDGYSHISQAIGVKNK